MPKPQDITGYTSGTTRLAEQGLLEVWRHLGPFHNHLVLVGGLVPRYLVGTPAHTRQKPHCGSMDVDLGVSLAVANVKTYSTIRERLIGSMGFVPGANAAGRQQRHSFVKTIAPGELIVDFLTVNYGGPKAKIRSVEKNLSAIQTEGLGLALENPLTVEVSGTLLSGGQTTESVRICRAVPFVILKALVLDDRGERKDAYDLVYTLTYYKKGPASVAAEITGKERKSDSFAHAMRILKKRFHSPSDDGPEKYARFLGEALPANRSAAYAAVQEFVKEIGLD